jgi:hypothetical protein
MEIKIHYQEPERIRMLQFCKQEIIATELLDSKMDGKMLADKVVMVADMP